MPNCPQRFRQTERNSLIARCDLPQVNIQLRHQMIEGEQLLRGERSGVGGQPFQHFFKADGNVAEGRQSDDCRRSFDRTDVAMGFLQRHGAELEVQAPRATGKFVLRRHFSVCFLLLLLIFLLRVAKVF